MRAIITLFTITLALVPSFGTVHAQAPDQQRCTLTVDQSPAVRGIRLGMVTEQVFALFPGSSERPETKNAIASAGGHPNYGVVGLYFQPFTYPSAAMERFSGIESISITLFDGRVTDMRVVYAGSSSYPRGPAWSNVDDFIAKLSEAFALPGAKDWLQLSESTKTLKCNGFDLEASTRGATGSIALRDNAVAYQDIVRQRAAADEEKMRREFKP